ncbi:MAG TPA: LysM domain-containing protein [Tepidisphaeraceae bacterium]|nr:LysM domain-containing protein [Tepidisphaeraceae bacterium]
MRKDVRLGFAVGGVLLAVIIVAVLVIHRNKNSVKTVAFDGGTTGVTPANPGPIDVTPKPSETPATETAAPAASGNAVATTPEAKPAPALEDPAKKDATRWDALFASTSADPIKAQLTNSATPKPKSHKNKPAVAKADDSAPMTGSQVDSGSPGALTARPSTASGSASDLAAAAPARGTDSSDAAHTHRVAAGETFVSISRAVYGDGKYFKAIQDANPTVTPEKLKPGTLIQIPRAEQVKQSKSAKSTASAAPASGPALSADGKTYTVQKNDNLYSIAKRLYGKGERGEEIYSINKQVIGSDSTRLKIGMVLQLPERPTVASTR